MEFSRQEYWSGLPFPSPGDLPDPGIKPRSSAFQADSLTSEPPRQQTQVQSLAWEDPLEKGMGTHSKTCLENSMDVGAWWARVHRVKKSRTRLSDFTSLLVFLPGEFHGQRSQEGYRPWGHRVGHDWVTNTFHFDFHVSTLLSSNYILKHISKKTENLGYKSICTWISIGTL